MLDPSNICKKAILDLLREAYIMSEFDHLNVLTTIGIVWSDMDPPLLVIPYMGKGNLLRLIRDKVMVSS